VADVDACTVVELRLAGSSDPEVFAAAIADGRTLLTGNIGDFTRISTDHLVAGQHHPGGLIAVKQVDARLLGSVLTHRVSA
jgi:hypothetical protein